MMVNELILLIYLTLLYTLQKKIIHLVVHYSLAVLYLYVLYL